MTISHDRRVTYENLTPLELKAVDYAADLVLAYLRENTSITPAGDDRAENLVGAIAKFVTECRPKDDIVGRALIDEMMA